MDASGEVADLMVKESIQLTEESIKLLAAGCKNLTAFLYALAKDNKKLVGKTSMKRLLREGKELKTFCIKAEDLNDFRKYAKPNILFAAIRIQRRMTVWWRSSPIRILYPRSICSCSAGAIPPPRRRRRTIP